eukprot:1165125-Amphidinium_carterae.1
MNNDEEEFFSAMSHDDQTSTSTREDNETCSSGRAFALPKKHSGGTRVACPLSLARPGDTCSAGESFDQIASAVHEKVAT